jgi:hypothetical protein
MSLVMTIYIREGIVVAADSRLTLNQTGQQGPQQVVQLAVGQTDSVYKVFLAPGNIAIATYGAADIQGVPIAGYVESFMQERLTDAPPVDVVPGLLLEYFRALSGPPATQFHVAGYKREAGASVQHVWLVQVAQNATSRINQPDQQGCSWGGEADVLARLVQPLWSRDQQGAYHELPACPIAWQFFTLQDAIDFAAYGIRATIDSMRFQTRSKSVGGAIDILVLKPTEASWIVRKELRAPSIAARDA